MTSTFPLARHLKDIEAEQRYRRRRVVQAWTSANAQTTAVVDGVEKHVFCGNDYLGLARHPRLTQAFQKAAGELGVGSGASHLITGHSREHHELEEALAAFTGRERALLFSTGYMANLGVAGALLGRGDGVLEDRLNHASLLDAGLLSGARLIRYPHADAAAVDAKLEVLARDARELLVMTDGVFSMDGDLAPVAQLAEATRRYGAWLVVDDAHGMGILGRNGRGTLEELNVSNEEVPVLMGTLGKALGAFGAFVAGKDELIEFLVQKARTYIYTTALPPAVAAATLIALRLIDEEPWRRARVQAHVERFRTAMSGLKLSLAQSPTPIQPIILGSASHALAVSEALWARGLWVAAIRPPTVPEGSARLRITFSAEHTEAQVEQLIAALAELAPQVTAQ